jgi:hypothetical protein
MAYYHFLRILSDPRHTHNVIDVEALFCQASDSSALDYLLLLGKEKNVPLFLAHAAKSRIAHLKTPAEVKQRAAALSFHAPRTLTPVEHAQLVALRNILRGKHQSNRRDPLARQLVECVGHRGYFITDDRVTRARGPDIAAALAVAIVTIDEFLEEYAACEHRSRSA